MTQSHSILVVDDELLIRDLLYDFFSGQGWKVTIAENAQRALEIMSDQEIDLVLSDIKMPGMDGLELTSQLHETHPEMPVVLMTGYPSVDTAVAALRSDVSDYIVKPFNINQLFKSILKTVSKPKSDTH